MYKQQVCTAFYAVGVYIALFWNLFGRIQKVADNFLHITKLSGM